MENRQRGPALLSLIGAMTLFGSIGVFTHYLPLPSGVIAFGRAAIGALLLLAVFLLTRKKLDFGAARRALVPLLFSGAALGFNWILLFEAYRYTTVTRATLCYYMAPILILLAAPLFLSEKMTKKSAICILLALGGMVLLSEPTTLLSGGGDAMGIIYGLAAAGLYATVVIFNRKMKEVAAETRTLVQLGISAVILLPYILLTQEASSLLSATVPDLLLLAVLGIFHTGIAYTLYFGAMGRLATGTVALLSYLDPLLAILFSALFLQEYPSPFTLLGGALILGASLLGEWTPRKKK